MSRAAKSVCSWKVCQLNVPWMWCKPHVLLHNGNMLRAYTRSAAPGWVGNFGFWGNCQQEMCELMHFGLSSSLHQHSCSSSAEGHLTYCLTVFQLHWFRNLMTLSLDRQTGKFCRRWTSHKRGITVNAKDDEKCGKRAGAPHFRAWFSLLLAALFPIHKPVSLTTPDALLKMMGEG